MVARPRLGVEPLRLVRVQARAARRASSSSPAASSSSSANSRIVSSIQKRGSPSESAVWRRRLFSTSEPSPSSTSIAERAVRGRRPPRPPRDGSRRRRRRAARRASSPRSSSSSWLQAIVPRSVRWRAARSCAPPVSRREPLVEPAQQRGRRERANARRRQLDRQRQPVEPDADLRHGRRVLVGDGEVGGRGVRPLDEQPHGLAVARAPRRPRPAQVGQRERRDAYVALAGQAQRHPARDQHAERRRRRRAARRRAGAAATPARSCRARAAARLSRRYSVSVSSAVSPGCSRRPSVRAIVGHDELPVADRRQRDEEDAVRNCSSTSAASLEREAGLAGAARARQRQQPHVVAHEQRARLGQLALAPDEGVRLRGQVRRPVLERRQRRELVRQAVELELVQPLRPREVLQPVLAEVAQAACRRRAARASPPRRAPARRGRRPSRARRGGRRARRSRRSTTRGSPGVQAHPHADSLPSGQSCSASARWPSAAAATASLAEANATKNASPSLSTTTPSCG